MSVPFPYTTPAALTEDALDNRFDVTVISRTSLTPVTETRLL